MKSDEKILKILNCIQEARNISINPKLVNLYITKADGLDSFDKNEVWDILYKIEKHDKVIKIESVPLSVALHATVDYEIDINNTQSHFSIEILDKFDNWLLKKYPREKIVEHISFNSKTGELNVNGKSVLLRRNTFRSDLVALMISNKKKVWEWEEIVGKIEDVSDDDVLKDSKKKFYPACDGLQKLIAQKTGISDFLIFNKSTVQINPKYLQAS